MSAFGEQIGDQCKPGVTGRLSSSRRRFGTNTGQVHLTKEAAKRSQKHHGEVMEVCKYGRKSVHVVEVLPSEFGWKVVGRWIAKIPVDAKCNTPACRPPKACEGH